MIRKHLNWFPGMRVGSMDDIADYDPWDLFPGKDVLYPADVPAIRDAEFSSDNRWLKTELEIWLAVIEAGGYIRREDVRRGVEDR